MGVAAAQVWFVGSEVSCAAMVTSATSWALALYTWAVMVWMAAPLPSLATTVRS